MYDKSKTIGNLMETELVDEWSVARAEREIEKTGIEDYLKNDGTYLDVGTGRGHIVQKILEDMDKKGKSLKNYFSVDIEAKVTERCQERERKRLQERGTHNDGKNPMNFVQAGADELPFKNETMDGVSFIFSLHHMRKSAIDKALREAVRITKGGGNIFVAEDIVGNGEERERCEKVDRALNFDEFDATYNYRDEKGWENSFRKLGLEVMDKKYFESKHRDVVIRHILYVLRKTT